MPTRVKSFDFAGTDRFELEERLGAGGMGVVYSAHDKILKTKVALKTIRSPTSDLLLRLKNEFRAMQDVRHPNLVGLGELFEADGAWFFTMDLVDGVDFVHWVRMRGLHPADDTGDGSEVQPRKSFERAVTQLAPSSASGAESNPDELQSDRYPLLTGSGGGRSTTSDSDSDSDKDRRSPIPGLRMSDSDSGNVSGSGNRIPGLESSGRLSSGPLAGLTSSEGSDEGSGERSGKQNPLTRPMDAYAITFDEERLRNGIVQLAEGLMALHESRRVHRDIKPTNILVSRAGEVIILDFGLVRENDAEYSTGPFPVGTAAYMAPEQAASRTVGPPADWYAVGVLLYECLTGQLPFSGAPLQIMMEKQTDDPPHPSAITPNVPKDLDALCVALMQYEPGSRPTGQKVLQLFGAEDGTAPRRHVLSTPSRRNLFVGRERELTVLRQVYEDDKSTGPVTVLVHGPSGVGKSELQRQLVRQLREQHPRLIPLVGRCLEHELVPYKALDGVVDSLSEALGRLPKDQVLQVLPRHADVLARVFPVLERVVVSYQITRMRQESLEPHEARSLAFRALKSLLAHLADIHPVLVVIDDIQWADADSKTLLDALLTMPDAPAITLVATLRTPTDQEEARLLVGESVKIFPCRTERISLGGLADAETRELATRLLTLGTDDPDKEAARAEMITAEADGHPLFVHELVRHAHSLDAAHHDRRGQLLRLDDAIFDRVSDLDRPQRELVEVVALAGRPIPQEVVMHATEQEPSDLARHLSVLRVGHLVRSGGVQLGDVVEPYHDRVREAVAARLTDAVRIGWHKKLAISLEALGHAEPELMAFHLEGAGDAERAAQFAADAAEQATATLAFGRAARLYRLALSNWPQDENEKRRQLWINLGEALAAMGHSAEAAEAYLKAVPGAKRAEALELECQVASQLLRGGHVPEGLAAMKKVSAALGMRLPKSNFGAVASLLLRRLQIRVRGMRFRQRDESQVSAEALVRVDINHRMATSLGGIDQIRGSDFSTRFAIAALNLGEPRRICNALTTEATYMAGFGKGDSRYARRLLRAAESLLAEKKDPVVQCYLQGTKMLKSFMQGHWRESHGFAVETETMSLKQRGMAYERGVARFFQICALWYLGELAELERRVPEMAQDAQSRGDLYAGSGLVLGLMNVVFLNREGPDAARQRIDSMMESWPLNDYQLQHYDALLARTQIDLYLGKGQRALNRVDKDWKPLRKSYLLTVPGIVSEALHLRARSLLAAVAELPEVEHADRKKLLRRAVRDTRRLEKTRLVWAPAFAELLRAGIEELRDNRHAAIACLERSIHLLKQVDAHLYRAAARRQLGKLLATEGNDDAKAGERLLATGTHYMEQQGVADPDQFTNMIAPGFPS
jgi:eukaryotic-like serine/threonine-protein kinase